VLTILFYNNIHLKICQDKITGKQGFFHTSLTSLLTGDNTAAMGILIPAFLMLEGFRGPGIYGFIALVYVSAFVGNVISPVHICLSLTKEFFQAELGKIYRFLAPPLLWALLATILLVTLNQRVL